MNDKALDQAFRPRARLLQHLGDQLIGTPRLAVFELVKNAYDADASLVEIELSGIGTEQPSIRVSDDGIGMSLDTVQDIWLVIAHDHKAKELLNQKRTKKGRLPLGSKGLGRLSVHKLGNKIRMITRAAGEKEVVVDIDWDKLIEHEFLSDAQVNLSVREPQVFKHDNTGTILEISELREKNWTRGEVRRLYRQVTSISSPFGQIASSDFEAILLVPEVPQWTEKLPDPAQLLKRAPWKYTFEFDGHSFSYQYSFRGIPGIQREARNVDENSVALLIPPTEPDDDDPLISGRPMPAGIRKIIADINTIEGIGPISGEFYVFDLTPRIAKQMGESQLIRDFLDENGGVRVYRDGIRVYDYGEQNNDWLGLDLRRVNNPTRGLSRNIVVGHILLQQNQDNGLIEKSNREGFIENAAYERFKKIVLGAIDPLQREREIDRKAIRELLGDAKDPETHNIMEPASKIRSIARKHNLSAKIDPLLDRIQNEYVDMKERLLSTGISGTSLAVVFHEIEQGVRSLHKNIENKPELEAISTQVEEMMKLLDGFSDLLRKKDRKPIDLRSIIRRARDLNRIRFRHHNVKLVCPALEETATEVIVSCSFGLTLGAVTNIIDNAIYWMRAKWPDENDANRVLYLDIDEDFDGGPAIIVADTGPGFSDAPSELVRPFYTRRPEGMGMGLYYANMVMELNDGRLMFPDPMDTDVPENFDGAILALTFAN